MLGSNHPSLEGEKKVSACLVRIYIGCPLRRVQFKF